MAGRRYVTGSAARIVTWAPWRAAWMAAMAPAAFEPMTTTRRALAPFFGGTRSVASALSRPTTERGPPDGLFGLAAAGQFRDDRDGRKVFFALAGRIGVHQLQGVRRTGGDARGQFAGGLPLQALVALDRGPVVTAHLQHAQRAHQDAQLAADAQVLIDDRQALLLVAVDGPRGADQRAEALLAVAALQRQPVGAGHLHGDAPLGPRVLDDRLADVLGPRVFHRAGHLARAASEAVFHAAGDDLVHGRYPSIWPNTGCHWRLVRQCAGSNAPCKHGG